MKIRQASIDHLNSYIPFNIDSLEIGATLLFNLFIRRENNYVIIIESGTLLSADLYVKLKKQEQLYISKMDEEKETLTCKP